MRKFLFLLIPIPGVISGALVAQATGVRLSAFYPNIAGIFLGVVATFIFSAKKIRAEKIPPRTLEIIAGISFVLLGATFFFADFSGAHRWLQIGPVSLNASAIVSPLLLFIFSEWLRTSSRRRAALGILLFVGWLHFFQPDAGQATSFSLAALVILGLNKNILRSETVFGTLVLFSAIFFTWSRGIDLPAVNHVERIFRLGLAEGPLAIAALFISTLLLFIPFAFAVNQRKPGSARNILGSAFLVYWVMNVAVTEFGNYPVPVLGAGASPVIGWMISVIILEIFYPDRHRLSR